MKTTTQEKKTDLRNLGFTEMTNLIMIKGGNTGDGVIDKSETTEDKTKKNDDQG